MYESLLRLPYFQGMSKDEITSILDKVAFDFHKLSDGETICERGERCDKFIIITNGEATSRVDAPDDTYSLTEEICAPYAIEPYSLFGQDTTFKRKYSNVIYSTTYYYCS